MNQALYYVYILESEAQLGRHYTGFTEDVEKRVQAHNWGECPHTAKYRPWRILTYFAFADREKAVVFERYLKSHSGRAFAKKHF